MFIYKMIIIPIGSCCEISFKLEKLKSKGETSLFEWHFSFNFKDILEVFKTISNGEELTYSFKVSNSYIDNTDIYSGHYRKIEEYTEMMNRRKERLVKQIKGAVCKANGGDEAEKGDNNIVFIRQITNNGVSTFPTQEDIKEFNSYIYKLNPNCKYRILFVVYTKDKIPTLEGVEYLLLNDDEKENIDLWEKFFVDPHVKTGFNHIVKE
jgi:hypothetical protein